ncbi:MAG: YciI family protein [Micropepsaceae bacterium]
MLYALICTDKPNSTALRLEVRPKHLAYIDQHKARIPIAGPFMSEDGQTMAGSLIIVEADSLDAAKSFSTDDPYSQAGLFSHVDVRPWRWTLGAPKV